MINSFNRARVVENLKCVVSGAKQYPILMSVAMGVANKQTATSFYAQLKTSISRSTQALRKNGMK